MSPYLEICRQLSTNAYRYAKTGLRLNTNKCEIIMEDFSKLDAIDTFKDFIRVEKAEMTLLGAPVLKDSA